MTVFYGVNADKLLVDTPRNLTDPGESGGALKVIYDTFELTAALTTSDTLRLGAKIPKGARIMDVHLFFDDLGTTGTFDVGWLVSDDAAEAADADGFGNAVDVKTAAGVYIMMDDQPTVAGIYKKFTAEVQPVITPDESTSATSGTVSIAIYYILN